MWKSRIAALLVVVAALVAVDLVVRMAAPAEAARSQIVTAPERFVSVSNEAGLFIRMTEQGKVQVYSWSGAHGSYGFPANTWVTLP